MPFEMNIIRSIILLAGGLVILWKCAGLLVGGAVILAKRLGVSPFIIGLTVVAMGTSAPEVAASIAAAARGAGDAAVGNVYGSNIANLALIGGLAALVRPIKTRRRTLRREIPAMLAVALLLWPVVHNLYLSRAEGVGLLGVFAALILLTIYAARREAAVRKNNDKMDSRFRGNDKKESGNDKKESGNDKKESGNDKKESGNDKKEGGNDKKEGGNELVRNVLFCVIGLVGLAFGATMTVEGAIFIGREAGLSEAVIGLTIIAIGTSLPELATCVVAAIKGQHDISIGNLVGSNIFNTLLVTGTAGVIRPFELAERLGGADYWIMIFVSTGFVLLAIAGRRTISRAGGALLLCGYIAYIVYLLAFSV